MTVIYVASPYSKGSISGNVRRACFAGDEILRKGHTPFIPHLSHLWELISPKPWGIWLRIDFALLAKCDALLRLPGESIGADAEVAEAMRLGKPIYYDLKDIPDVKVTERIRTLLTKEE